MVLVENKIDLIQEAGESSLTKALKEQSSQIPTNAFCSISTFYPRSIEELKKTLYNQIKKIAVQGDVVVSNARHYEALQNAFGAII